MGDLTALLICVPVVFAVILALVSSDKARGIITYCGGIIIMALSVFTVVSWVKSGGRTVTFELPFNEAFEKLTLYGDLALMVLIIVLSFRYHKAVISLISIVQTAVVCWTDVFGPDPEPTLPCRVDQLTCIMILIVGIVGSLIGIYAVGYMRGYHLHHKEYRDRRRFFFCVMFVFYAAMFGLVTSQDLLWLDFFWETTSVCSFLLIGYTQTDEAVTNCFRALWMNLLGGLGFAVVIWFGGYVFHTFNLYKIIKISYMASGDRARDIGVMCIAWLSFAALTKTAQFPFSKWLLGAMVAPTPSSALLHSATMVKAGVYLLIRLSPALGATHAGILVYLVGGFTFFAASLLAISQSDGKKVLAYSTISNLGLMAACAGIGTPESVWAAVFLMMFHAVSKSMCFQAVGAIENTTGSRDIEDMQGLMIRLPKLAAVLLTGMAGMYLAPFGMLISKWAALKTFIDSGSAFGSVVMILFLCFGSATTMFYWSKWMSKLPGTDEKPVKEDRTQNNEYASMFIHGALAVLLVICFPLVSSNVVSPFINKYMSFMSGGSFSGFSSSAVMNTGNLRTMVVMLVAVIVVPAVNYLLSRDMTDKVVPAYMSGINTGDNRHFVNSFGEPQEAHVSNWYMEQWFGEKKLFLPCVIIGTAIIIIMLGIFVGGAVL